MESRKFNLNKFFNNLIAGVSLVLASLLIGLCFVTPTASIKASALTLTEITDEYKIKFVSAKTKVLKAEEYTKQEFTDINGNKFNEYSYVYTNANFNSNDTHNLYTSDKSSLDTTINNLPTDITSYSKYKIPNSWTQFNGYIPSEVTHFKNSNGEMEEIFYDNFTEGDFVVLNNNESYVSYVSDTKFDVENVYLSFGSAFSLEDDANFLPLHEVRVSATLTNETGVHDISVNEQSTITIEGKQYEYWAQYLDLNNVREYKTDDSDVTYPLKETSGLYTFSFRFIRYDENLVKDTEYKTFNYSFYLIDNSDYMDYPTIHNAELHNNTNNEYKEYFYNFANDTPYVSFNPNRYNLSYVKEANNLYRENKITSTYKIKQYLKDGNKYPLGIISFNELIESKDDKGNTVYTEKLLKDVYVLTHYNKIADSEDFDYSLVEHLFLSSTENIALFDSNIVNFEDAKDASTTTIDSIKELLEYDDLTFEYKQVKILDNTSSYKVTTYKTYEYDDYAFITNKDKINANYIKTNEETILSDSKTAEHLNILLDENKISTEFEYDYRIDNISEYTIKYSYVYLIADNTNIALKEAIIDNNYTTPFDYNVVKGTTTGSQVGETPTPTPLVYNTSAYLDTNNKVTIGGITYEYDNSNKQQPKLLVNDNSNNTTISLTDLAGEYKGATLQITENISGIILSISYEIGEITRVETNYSTPVFKTSSDKTAYYNIMNNNSSTDAQKKDAEKYIYYSIKYSTIKEEITFDDDTTDNYSDTTLTSIIKNIKDSYSRSIVNSKDTYTIISRTSNTYSSFAFGGDSLHIFGSIAYFNKEVSPEGASEVEFSKLEKINTKTDENYFSDVTKYYVKNTSNTNKVSSASDLSGFSKELIDDKHISASSLIYTDYSSIFWKNLSNLLYNDKNIKISESRVYEYNGFTFNDDGKLILPTEKTESIYTKDMHCPIEESSTTSYDGIILYEVVIFYTYADYYDDSQIFYQLFTFVIDNSNPKFVIETTENGEDYTPLANGVYTNKDFRISWNIPNYFKHNITLQLVQKDYDNTTTRFNKEYNGETLLNIYNKYTYTDDYATFTKDDNKYYVSLVHNEENNNLNGKFKASIKYGPSSGASTSTSFIFDRENIEGINIKPIIKNDDDKYVINHDITFAEGQQIINTDFTLRFNEKESGAKITTKYYKIPLTENSYSATRISTSDGQAITTNFTINGDSAEIENMIPYNFDPTKASHTGNDVNNLYLDEENCIYLFVMYDDAGNTNRYVVFRDQTNPRFLVEPEPENKKNNIVSNTTLIDWGDYKAIKIDTTISEGIKDNTNNISNIKFENKLIEALSYINTSFKTPVSDDSTTQAYYPSSEAFNRTRVELINDSYYILIPVTNVEIKDEYNVTISENNGAKDVENASNKYYFFPTDPFDSEKANIKLINDTSATVTTTPSVNPRYNTNNQIVGNYISAQTSKGMIFGLQGSGLYFFNIYDKLGNHSTGDLWVNLDQTQTMAYGIFDYSANISNAIGLTNEQSKSYSAAQLYMTSLTDESIPAYEVTYRYHGLNSKLYDDYTIKTATLREDTSGIYLVLTLSANEDPNDVTKNKTVEMLIKEKYEHPNEEEPESPTYSSYDYPAYSYPYDLEAKIPHSDTSGKALNLYNKTNPYYAHSDDPNRVFSDIINKTTDANGNWVTKEGLYIFKRTYTDPKQTINENDSRIIYRVYYVDRSGIINIYSDASTSSTLFNVGEDIGFVLGSGTNYESEYTASSVIKKAISNNTSSSNSTLTKKQLFTTNKVNVKFNLTYDKFNFNKFYSKYNGKIEIGKEDVNASAIEDYLETRLLDKTTFENIYKLDLMIKKGENYTPIIDETNTNSKEAFNSELIETYLKYNSTTSRENSYYLYYGDNINNYIITLSDKSGYIKRNTDNTISNLNYLNNNLTITFNINHKAPTGEIFGKDYDGKTITVPSTEKTTEAILTRYINEGKLLDLTKVKSNASSLAGETITLYNTNNESLIFMFSEPANSDQARIDTENISISQIANGKENIIFKRTNGEFDDKSTETIQSSAFKTIVIDDTTYHAIIVFDNQLDNITNIASKDRLIAPEQNYDEAQYQINIQYVGYNANSNNYIGISNNNTTYNYGKTTYVLNVDRTKPSYNLNKLIENDKYLNKDNVSQETLSKYFFAVDYRQNYSFKFEYTNSFDTSTNLYIRPLAINESNFDIQNYKHSITEDDYEVFENGSKMDGHTRFIPSESKILSTSEIDKGTDLLLNTYYQINYDLFGTNKTTLDIKDLVDKRVLRNNSYYEVIEHDEAGNYVVYGIYVPLATYGELSFDYYQNNLKDSKQNITLSTRNDPKSSPSGLKLQIKNYTTYDKYIKAILNVTTSSNNLNETTIIYYNPADSTINITNEFYTERAPKITVNKGSYLTDFVKYVNEWIEYYNSEINNSPDVYGHIIDITVLDRIGIISRNSLSNYLIHYTAAGGILPFKPVGDLMHIPEKQGYTYITNVKVFKFNKVWDEIDVDANEKTFKKSPEDLAGFDYYLDPGVYKIELTDNFARTTTYYHEYNMTPQVGGRLQFVDGKYTTHTDGYKYSSNEIKYTYDSSYYDIYIKFYGQLSEDTGNVEEIIYSSKTPYTAEELNYYGISSIITNNGETTITFVGTQDLTKYHIKTLIATTATNYEFGDEENNPDIIVYDNKIAVYTAIQSVIVRNLNGNILDSSEHLNLTEDFELMVSWTDKNLPTSSKIDFDAQIILTRTYKGVTTTEKVPSEYIVTLPGNYTAYVINDLGNISSTISFTRGEGDISIYGVYAIDKDNSPDTKLFRSDLSTSEEENKTTYHYFTTDKFFNYIDSSTNTPIIPFGEQSNISDYADLTADDLYIIKPITNKPYIDVKVNSNLSIFAQMCEIGNDGNPYIKYKIYSINNSDAEPYVYRYIKITFLDSTINYLTDIKVYSNSTEENLAFENEKYKNSIESTAKKIYVDFDFFTDAQQSLAVAGNTLFVERYYDGKLVETKTANVTDEKNVYITFTLETVGLHQFKVYDLAGRKHMFTADTLLKTADTMTIELVNQILFTINDETPINGQVFNDSVKLNVLFLSIEPKSLIITTYYNSEDGIDTPHNNGEVLFTRPGYYTIKMIATTMLTDKNIPNQEIYTTYNFVIIDKNVAQDTFSISKGYGFTIEKIEKIITNYNSTEIFDITNEHTGTKSSLVWLDHTKFGKCTARVTLTKFISATNEYKTFTFDVWINNEAPEILSNINEGDKTNNVIEVNFDPYQIYMQVGKCYVKVNDKIVYTIDENNKDSIIQTIKISEKGEHIVSFVSEDGDIKASYTFTKTEPLNSVTKIILIVAGIAVVVLVVLFVLLRKKGKYR